MEGTSYCWVNLSDQGEVVGNVGASWIDFAAH
jgi:hypothetical protein